MSRNDSMNEKHLPQAEFILYQTEDRQLLTDSVIRKSRVTAANGITVSRVWILAVTVASGHFPGHFVRL